VLKDISFEVEKGEFVAIMGKSGSGKSTLLYLLSTMDTDYKGNISMNGSTVTGLKQDQLARFRNEHIGFVFQFHYLLPEFTVLDNVMLPALKLKKKSKDEIENEAIRLLTLLGIGDQAPKEASRISGGQQQRVAIARALMQKPKMVLADEPIASLDPLSAEKVMTSLREIRDRDQLTVICNLHTLDTARTYCDRVIGMLKGRLVFDDAPSKLTAEVVQEVYGANQELDESVTSTSIINLEPESLPEETRMVS